MDEADELVRWLGEQLDLDAAKARACAGNGEWDARDIAIYGADLAPEVRAHMAEHDPARVLREIDAKRRVLTDYTQEAWVMEQGHRTGWTEGGQSVREHLIKVWAAIYDQRPGYREEWRP